MRIDCSAHRNYSKQTPVSSQLLITAEIESQLMLKEFEEKNIH
jgi:hypothetical protein